MSKEFLVAKNLYANYGKETTKTKVLNQINLTLKQGRIGVLIGPSGCGKSTFLNIIAGLKMDYEGEVSIEGVRPAEYEHTSLILQDYGLLPWKTVWENIILGLKIKKTAQEIVENRTVSILQKLGLFDLADRYPAQLSGGQRQRVAIARSLVLEPRLLLMDEPFSSLDALTREEMQNLLLEIWQETKLTILMVTHNIEEAVYLGQDIFLMSPLPSTIKASFKHELINRRDHRNDPKFLQMAAKLRNSLQEVI